MPVPCWPLPRHPPPWPPGSRFRPRGGVPEPYPGANLPPAPVPPQIHTVTRTVLAGGMPGWQITLIAVGAALLAAVVAVLADRARAARRHVIATAA